MFITAKGRCAQTWSRGPHPNRVVWPTPIYGHFPFENMNRNLKTALRNENETESNGPMRRDFYQEAAKGELQKKLGSLWKHMECLRQCIISSTTKRMIEKNGFAA